TSKIYQDFMSDQTNLICSMASKNVRGQKGDEQNIGVATRRTGKKTLLQTGSTNENRPQRRSPRLADKTKPSQAIIAAKRNARLRQANKKSPEIVIKDIYHMAREAKDMIRKQTGLIYDRHMTEHRCIWDQNYPECPERFSRVLERCEQLGLVSRCLYIEPREATEKEILVKHLPEQIAILKATSQCNDEEFLEELSSRFDAIYIHPSTYHLSLLAAGSTIELVDAICTEKVQNGMAIIRPPGHHAMKSEYCGYCFFNNVAIAAMHALTYCGISKILIVDWDVHHGQATQQMFYNDPRVVYFSLHRYEHGSFWPNLRESEYDFIGDGPGTGYNFNIPLNNVGMTDADYLAVFHQVLLPMASEFQPELILISAGYDAAIGCPEGEMEVTPACYTHLLNSLLCLASGKVAVVLEGGYCLQSLAEGAALTLRTLLGDPCPPLPSLKGPCEGIRETILNVIYTHCDYWQCYHFQDKFSVHAESNKKMVQHIPTVKFLSSEKKPDKYETRNCYPIQSKEFIDGVTRRLNLLIANTKLTFAPNRVCLVYDERMMRHKNISDVGHPEKPERISAIFSKHEEYGLLTRCHMLKARAVTEEELLLLHTRDHIDTMKETADMKLHDLTKMQDEYRSIYFHPGSYQAACLAAGCVLQVVDSVLNGECRSGVAIVRPPGHHAEEDEPCGFCMFNNVSLAAKYAIEVHGLKRILLLDWDVHHGNGSQHMFESDPRVLYISLHRYDNGSFFPSSSDANYNVVGSRRGEGFNVNIPWNKSGMTAVDYLTAFYQVILPISYQFSPELVLVSAGFDACIGDPLGGCKVSPEAYGHFTHLLTGLAGGRVILSLEGGYNLNSIGHAMPICTKALLGDPLPSLPSHTVACPSAVNTIRNVIRTHSKYWSALCYQVALPQENILPKCLNFHYVTASEFNIGNDTAIETVPDITSLLEESLKLSSDTSPEVLKTLVSYLSENIQMLLGGEMFAVVPLKSCPHLNRVEPVPAGGVNCNTPCVECGSDQENWVCLVCYTVHCGRFVNEHMMVHGLENSHPLTLSFSDLSVWCYQCEAYIDNHPLFCPKNAVHRSKFGEDMPWSNTCKHHKINCVIVNKDGRNTPGKHYLYNILNLLEMDHLQIHVLDANHNNILMVYLKAIIGDRPNGYLSALCCVNNKIIASLRLERKTVRFDRTHFNATHMFRKQVLYRDVLAYEVLSYIILFVDAVQYVKMEHFLRKHEKPYLFESRTKFHSSQSWQLTVSRMRPAGR
ncbi:hypothetical protein L9F63_003564, partial [Diploptera punctata]